MQALRAAIVQPCAGYFLVSLRGYVLLNPHPFFPSATHTIFVDFKLELRLDAAVLIERVLLKRNASFGAFMHPCATVPGYNNTPQCRHFDRYSASMPFVLKEMDVVQRHKKTAEPERLDMFRQDIEKWGEQSPVHPYIEGAFFVQDQSYFAKELSCNWQRVYAHGPDRDQFSFPIALALTSNYSGKVVLMDESEEFKSQGFVYFYHAPTIFKFRGAKCRQGRSCVK